MNISNALIGPDQSLMLLLLAALAGLAVFVLFFGIVTPQRGKPMRISNINAEKQLAGIQTRLDKAQIEISAEEYVRRSLTLGIPLAIGLFVLIGSIIMAPVGLLAGFLFTWNKLEQERDRKLIKYSKQLASVCDACQDVRRCLIRRTLRVEKATQPDSPRAMAFVPPGVLSRRRG